MFIKDNLDNTLNERFRNINFEAIKPLDTLKIGILQYHRAKGTFNESFIGETGLL